MIFPSYPYLNLTTLSLSLVSPSPSDPSQCILSPGLSRSCFIPSLPVAKTFALSSSRFYCLNTDTSILCSRKLQEFFGETILSYWAFIVRMLKMSVLSWKQHWQGRLLRWFVTIHPHGKLDSAKNIKQIYQSIYQCLILSNFKEEILKAERLPFNSVSNMQRGLCFGD